MFFDFRYSFLVSSFREYLPPTREGCKLVLARLKIEGWALGKTKVFLKYYHVECLTKIYEEQVSIDFRVPQVNFWDYIEMESSNVIFSPDSKNNISASLRTSISDSQEIHTHET